MRAATEGPKPSSRTAVRAGFEPCAGNFGYASVVAQRAIGAIRKGCQSTRIRMLRMHGNSGGESRNGGFERFAVQ